MTFASSQFSGVGAHEGSSQIAILGSGIFDGVGIDIETDVDGAGISTVVGAGIVLDVGVVDEDSRVNAAALLLASWVVGVVEGGSEIACVWEAAVVVDGLLMAVLLSCDVVGVGAGSEMILQIA